MQPSRCLRTADVSSLAEFRGDVDKACAGFKGHLIGAFSRIMFAGRK